MLLPLRFLRLRLQCPSLVLGNAYHITAINLKWPKALKSSETSKKRTGNKNQFNSVKIWKGMTFWDLAISSKRDLDFIENIMKPEIQKIADSKTGEINFNLVSKFLKNHNISYKVIEPPVKSVTCMEPKIQESHEIITNKTNHVTRPPVVTIMGHVDHGKTTLLDALRNSNITETEFGGITQHIGAFSVTLKPGHTVTFIDTPGHAAFMSLRNRGARITDIVVLVVAADDGVMEQTIESINMAKNAGVPIIVAVNKIDKTSGDMNHIKNQLLQAGVKVEDFGGDVQIISISALKRINLSLLIEAILTEADMMMLTGDPNAPVKGVVLESSIKSTGRCATVLVKQGTLRKRTVIVSGTAVAKVRQMFDEKGFSLSEVRLSQPAEITGWRDLPVAGDIFTEVSSEKEALKRVKVERRLQLDRKAAEDMPKIKEKSLIDKIEDRKRKEEVIRMKTEKDIESLKEFYRLKPKVVENKLFLNIIVKGDTNGSVESITNIIKTYDYHECSLNVVKEGVGQITPGDLELAITFNATIYCFNVDYPQYLKEDIIKQNIRVKFYNVIYKLFEDLKEEITELLPLQERENIIGEAVVLEPFRIRVGKQKIPVAGSLCQTGELRKKNKFRLIRDGEVLHEGNLRSLKHFKDDVKFIKKDSQCGIMFEDFSGEFKKDDKIICIELEWVKPKVKWNPGF